jgi:hypothetical protein
MGIRDHVEDQIAKNKMLKTPANLGNVEHDILKNELPFDKLVVHVLIDFPPFGQSIKAVSIDKFDEFDKNHEFVRHNPGQYPTFREVYG